MGSAVSFLIRGFLEAVREQLRIGSELAAAIDAGDNRVAFERAREFVAGSAAVVNAVRVMSAALQGWLAQKRAAEHPDAGFRGEKHPRDPGK